MNTEQIFQEIKAGVANAIEEHRLKGESISFYKDGKIVTLTAEEITPLPHKKQHQTT